MKKIFSRKGCYRPAGYTLGYLAFALVLLSVTVILFVAFNLIDERFNSGDGWQTVFAPSESHTVILDAGHGGLDGGANITDENGNALLEKNLNLEYTLLLGDFLSDLGVNVIYTRESDIMLDNGGSEKMKLRDLKARVDIANSNPDAVFVSIHMNKFPESYVHGIQLYYSPNNSGSIKLAENIKSDITKLISPDNNREIKKAGSDIYILNRIKSPCVLVECGFISNPAEAELLKNDEYRHKLVLAVGSAILEFICDSDS